MWFFGQKKRNVTLVRSAQIDFVILGRESLDTTSARGADFSAVQKYYPGARSGNVESVDELMKRMEQFHADILFLYSEIYQKGNIATPAGNGPGAVDTLDALQKQGVTTVWFASECHPDIFLKSSMLISDLNCIVTQRRGSGYSRFLGDVFRELKGGKVLPQAWQKIAPQAENLQSDWLPECIFFPSATQRIYCTGEKSI